MERSVPFTFRSLTTSSIGRKGHHLLKTRGSTTGWHGGSRLIMESSLRATENSWPLFLWCCKLFIIWVNLCTIWLWDLVSNCFYLSCFFLFYFTELLCSSGLWDILLILCISLTLNVFLCSILHCWVIFFSSIHLYWSSDDWLENSTD